MPTNKPKPARAAGAADRRKKIAALVHEAKTTSEASRKRAEALLVEIARRMLRIAEDFYDIGEALRELQKKKLFLALGYASFAQMLAARKVMSAAQANKLIKIVSTLSRDRALSVGSEKAALLAAYAEATPEPDTPEWLLDKGTLPGGKRVADASTRELADAIKKTRGAGSSKAKSPEEASARSGARRAQAALRKRGAKGATAEAVKKGSSPRSSTCHRHRAKGATAEAVKKAGTWWLRIELPAEAAKLLER